MTNLIMHAARRLAEQGRFDGFANALPAAALNSLFSKPEKPSFPS